MIVALDHLPYRLGLEAEGDHHVVGAELALLRWSIVRVE